MTAAGRIMIMALVVAGALGAGPACAGEVPSEAPFVIGSLASSFRVAGPEARPSMLERLPASWVALIPTQLKPMIEQRMLGGGGRGRGAMGAGAFAAPGMPGQAGQPGRISGPGFGSTSMFTPSSQFALVRRADRELGVVWGNAPGGKAPRGTGLGTDSGNATVVGVYVGARW